MKRIFIGLKVNPDGTFLKMISSLKSGLSNDKIKWTNPDNIHITLAFLGNTDETQVKPLSSMLKEKCEGSGTFELVIRGAGVFGNFNDPRIIWTGIGPSDELLQLNENVLNGLKELNIQLEERPFKPHLTIGRIKHLSDKEAFKVLVEQFKNSEIQRIPVNEIILYESILIQPGPVYKPLSKINLGRA